MNMESNKAHQTQCEQKQNKTAAACFKKKNKNSKENHTKTRKTLLKRFQKLHSRIIFPVKDTSLFTFTVRLDVRH